MIQPGAKKTITFELTDKELGFYDNDGNYKVEDGEFVIMIGGDSKNVEKTTVERKTVSAMK